MNKLISEDEIENIKFNQRKDLIEHYHDKEEFLKNIPYADEQVRLPYNKFINWKTLTGRFSTLAAGFSIAGAIFHSQLVYGYINFHNLIKSYFPAFFVFNYTLFILYVMPIQSFQSVNRDDMEPSDLEQEMFRTLVNKCDLYDHLDALLELKEKYSLYEIEQLNKEINRQKSDIISENMDLLKEMRLKGKL